MATNRNERSGSGRTLLAGAVLLVLTLVVVALIGGGDEPADEIRPAMLDAYVAAIEQLPQVAPRCEGLTWPVLAGIGRIESGHARGSEIDADGDTDPWILGPRLDGSGAGGNVTPIYDTDGGLWDLDEEYDRAVGPMQFIPTSWRIYGRDATGDGQADPHNVYDAALGAAVHLCGSGPVDLSDPSQLRQAVFGYNQSRSYVEEVLRWADRYAERYGESPGDG